MAVKEKSSGFALIFVIVFTAVIISIISELIFQSQGIAKKAMTTENQLYAKLAARTGLDFSLMMLSLNKIAKNYQNNPNLPIKIPQNFYGVLNGQPIGTSSFDDINKLSGIDLSSNISPSILNSIKNMKGYFVINISSENSKFNLNLLQSSYSQIASKALLRLFSTKDAQDFLALYNYSPQQLVDNLVAYIKISNPGSSTDSSVLADYKKLNLNYGPKHAALESLEELRRIPGFHIDEIYKMFSPYFTIWPISGPQNTFNINTAPIELISTFVTPDRTDIDDKAWDKFEDYRIDNRFEQNNVGSWFKKNLPSFAQDKQADDFRNNIIGVDDTVFRIECRGVYDNVEKKVIMVVNLAQNNQSSPQSMANPTSKGTPKDQQQSTPLGPNQTGGSPGASSSTSLSTKAPDNIVSSASLPYQILSLQWVN